DHVTQELNRLPQVSGPAGAPEQIFVTQRLSRVLTQSEEEAAALKDEYVSIEHLLLTMGDERGAASKLLPDPGIKREALMAEMKKVRGMGRVTSQTPETTYQALEKLGCDFTKLAGQGKLDSVIGRDD